MSNRPNSPSIPPEKARDFLERLVSAETVAELKSVAGTLSALPDADRRAVADFMEYDLVHSLRDTLRQDKQMFEMLGTQMEMVGNLAPEVQDMYKEQFKLETPAGQKFVMSMIFFSTAAKCVYDSKGDQSAPEIKIIAEEFAKLSKHEENDSFAQVRVTLKALGRAMSLEPPKPQPPKFNPPKNKGPGF